MTVKDDRPGFHVLVIEDDADTRAVLTYVLEHEGFSVESASDGERGLEAIRTLRPDLVLLDLLMPRLGGGEVALALERSPELRHIPVITVSASPLERRPAHARAHLVKPFRLHELLELIRAVRACPDEPAPRGRGGDPTPPAAGSRGP